MAYIRDQQLCTTTIVLFAIVPLVVCHTNCDIGGCSILFQSTFSDLFDGLENFCRGIGNILKCVNDCHKTFFPHFISTNTTVHFLNEVCNGDFMYVITDENWKCIHQHFNRLLTCVATSSSLESLQHKQDNRKLLSCKKVLSILNCPEEVLFNQCEDKVVEIVNEAFQLGLKPLFEASCFKISSNKASNLNVQPRLDTGYYKTAVCMDNYEDLARNCFHKYLEKAAHSELNECSEEAETICTKPSSSIPCSPPSLVGNFYSTILSYGKLECKNLSNVYQLKPHSNPSVTEGNAKERPENIEKTTLMKDAIPDLSYVLPKEKATHPQLELNITTSSLSTVDFKKSYSTINPTTDDTSILEYDDLIYPTSSTILPDNMNKESVLSDAPENNTSLSNSFHTSCGTVFVSFTYIFSILFYFILLNLMLF